MATGIGTPPLIRKLPLIKGFLAGSLVAGGLVFPFGGPAQAALFLAGILIFIDTIIPGEQAYIITAIFAAIGGGILSLLFAVLGSGFWWGAIVIAITLLFYLHRVSGRLRKKEKRQTSEQISSRQS